MDYAVAVAKITAMAGEAGWEEDLDLRGEHGSFERTVRQLNAMPDWMFTFGKLSGTDIRVSEDVWQLTRAMEKELGGRRRVIARQRLMELGEYYRFNWVSYQNFCYGPNEIDEEYRTEAASDAERAALAEYGYFLRKRPVTHKYATKIEKQRV